MRAFNSLERHFAPFQNIFLQHDRSSISGGSPRLNETKRFRFVK
jgi:hypothetical protein